MNRYTLLIAAVAIFFVAIVYFSFRILKSSNRPDWERVQRRRIQGPFVPLSTEQIAEDEARIPAARAKRTS